MINFGLSNEPDDCKWQTRILKKILPHLLVFENTKKVHDAIEKGEKENLINYVKVQQRDWVVVINDQKRDHDD